MDYESRQKNKGSKKWYYVTGDIRGDDKQVGVETSQNR